MSAIKSETVTHMIIVLGTLVAQIEMSHKLWKDIRDSASKVKSLGICQV